MLIGEVRGEPCPPMRVLAAPLVHGQAGGRGQIGDGGGPDNQFHIVPGTGTFPEGRLP